MCIDAWVTSWNYTNSYWSSSVRNFSTIFSRRLHARRFFSFSCVFSATSELCSVFKFRFSLERRLHSLISVSMRCSRPSILASIQAYPSLFIVSSLILGVQCGGVNWTSRVMRWKFDLGDFTDTLLRLEVEYRTTILGTIPEYPPWPF